VPGAIECFFALCTETSSVLFLSARYSCCWSGTAGGLADGLLARGLPLLPVVLDRPGVVWRLLIYISAARTQSGPYLFCLASLAVSVV
jgi:hypothetical protein